MAGSKKPPVEIDELVSSVRRLIASGPLPDAADADSDGPPERTEKLILTPAQRVRDVSPPEDNNPARPETAPDGPGASRPQDSVSKGSDPDSIPSTGAWQDLPDDPPARVDETSAPDGLARAASSGFAFLSPTTVTAEVSETRGAEELSGAAWEGVTATAPPAGVETRTPSRDAAKADDQSEAVEDMGDMRSAVTDADEPVMERIVASIHGAGPGVSDPQATVDAGEGADPRAETDGPESEDDARPDLSDEADGEHPESTGASTRETEAAQEGGEDAAASPVKPAAPPVFSRRHAAAVTPDRTPLEGSQRPSGTPEDERDGDATSDGASIEASEPQHAPSALGTQDGRLEEAPFPVGPAQDAAAASRVCDGKDDDGGGTVPAQDAREMLDGIGDDALRALIAEVVREELQGVLGQRITRNVRKMVRREIRLLLASDRLD